MNIKKILIIIGIVLVILFTSLIIAYKTMFIGQSKVKDIIADHLETEVKNIQKWDIGFSYENGLFTYEAEVVFNNQEYDYEINAKTGEIILHKLEH